MCLTQADDRPAHLTRVHQALTALPRGRPAAAGRDRGLEARPAPADLPADRVHLRPGRATRSARTSPTGCPPGAAGDLRRPAGGHPSRRQFKDASTSLAVDWTDLESFSRPPPARGGPLRRPRGLLGAPQEQPAAQPGRAVLRLLPLRRDHDARGERARRPRARPPRHGLVVPARPGPRVRPGPDRDARRRASRSATSSPTPATPTATPAPGHCRCGRRRASSSRTCTRTTAAPRAPTTAPSSPTATCTARPHPARCWNSGRWPAPPPAEQAADHDAKTAELARYKLGRLTADDADGYHRVQCPAAMGKIRCPLRPASMTLDRDRPEILTPPNTPRPAAPSRPSPSRPR